MKAAWIILIAAAVLCGQTTTKKAPLAKPDTWQKSKDCASQAEKVMAEHDRRAATTGGVSAMHWENHYSPKYDRCFISATFLFHSKDGGGKAGPLFSTQLIDAFERSVLANSASVGPTNGFCDIDEKYTDCARAATFIAEHMKN